MKDFLAPPKTKVKYTSWGQVFRNAVARGEDHGWAAFIADRWEKKQQRKQKEATDDTQS